MTEKTKIKPLSKKASGQGTSKNIPSGGSLFKNLHESTTSTALGRIAKPITDILNALKNRVTGALNVLAPIFTIQNILMFLAGVAIAHFIIRSVIQTMLYINIILIAHRVMHPKSSSNQHFLGKPVMRKSALIAALSGLVLDFAIPVNSVLTFVLFAPLVAIIALDLVNDCIRHQHGETVARTWIPYSLNRAWGNICTDWDYLLVTAPYFHRTVLGGLSLLACCSLLYTSPAFQTVYALVGNQYLPLMLSTLSTIGGISLLQASKDAIASFAKEKTQTVIQSVQLNPLLPVQLYTWACNMVSTADRTIDPTQNAATNGHMPR